MKEKKKTPYNMQPTLIEEFCTCPRGEDGNLVRLVGIYKKDGELLDSYYFNIDCKLHGAFEEEIPF